MRKVSIRTVEIAIGMARSMANGTTKWPFLGSCADLMARMLEEIKEARKKNESTKTPPTTNDDEADVASGVRPSDSSS